ncbi:MAG TPA: helix-turn-helix domain-containing protein [Streptosporangiaceae bacterium]|nr:helix-turn-helix domain-containing protein [Streptosporangiaceae bacterium]
MRESVTGPARAQRADARSNRAAILDAAQEVFGEGGESASTEEVARRAGVGIATVFRHFPTKSELLVEVLVQRFGRLRDRAAELTGDANPGEALFVMFTEIVTDAPGKIAIADALVDAGGVTGRAEQASQELSQAVDVLLRRAQQAGAIRADVGLPEFYALMVGMSRAGAHAQLDLEVRTRAQRVIFDGLTPAAATEDA